MTTSTCSDSFLIKTPPVERQVERFGQSARLVLDEALSLTFDLWVPGEPWCALPPDAPGGDNPGQSAPATPTETLTQLLDAALRSSQEPRAVPQEGNLYQLVVPIAHEGKVILVATATIETNTPELYCRLATSTLNELDQRGEIARIESENYNLAMHMSEDLEQLTFLREIADRLEVSELSFDLVRMAKTVLPLLNELIKAESLALIAHGAIDPAETDDAFGSPGGLLWFGPSVVEESVCIDLVRHYSTDAERQPVVKNRFSETQAGEPFPGVVDFVIVPIVKANKQMGWLLALNRINEREENTTDALLELSRLEFGTCEASLLSSAASILATHACNVQLFREKEQLLTNMVCALVSTIEAKDDYTRGHSERVALFSQRLGLALGMDQEGCERLYLTGLLHDVGKIGVSDATLKKPGRLTEEEFEEIKQHPDKGWGILHDLDHLRQTLPGVLFHHESYDGSGYPDGLVGEDIPLDGRILAVCDAFDAMTSDRPYRAGMPREKAEAILRDGAGAQWDPDVVKEFFRVLPEILKIRQAYRPRPQAVREQFTVREISTDATS